MASKALIESEPAPALERTASDRAGGDGSKVAEGRAPLWSFLRVREEQEKALPAAAEYELSKAKPEPREESQIVSSHSSDGRVHVETA